MAVLRYSLHRLTDMLPLLATWCAMSSPRGFRLFKDVWQEFDLIMSW